MLVGDTIWPWGGVLAGRRAHATLRARFQGAPIVIEMGTLTRADVTAFKTLCELQATLDLASIQKDAPEFAPFTLSEDFNGAPKMGLHAAIKLEKEYAPVIRPYYALFGLEPVSRARIQVRKPKDEPVSKWAGVLK